ADLTSRFKAGDLVQHISTQLGGKGGGRPDMAQGGGTNVAALPQALNSVSLWLQQK
ncbi:MAG TPA: DHHA1 domain-containing protein, partial [Agitococcus sp.]|nr:DHHA1 domain-containing protein [Agitococcus sp.]